MFEIKFTLDATPELISAMRDLAGAIHSVSCPVPDHAKKDCGTYSKFTVKCEDVEISKNSTDEAAADPKQTEISKSAEEPKKRKSRAKKAPSDSEDPVSPSAGDDLSPIGANEEPAKEVADPAPVDGSTPSHEQKTGHEPASEPPPAEEAPSARDEDPRAGKGQTGEILAELTRKAIGDLDALGVDRGDANRRIRDYCARNDIKFPTFPALLNAVGYAEAIEICKGAMK